jgi:hypothetical protein
MLTWEALELHRSDGKLVSWMAGKKQTRLNGRCLYMFPDVFDAFVKKPWPATMSHTPRELKNRRLAMRAVLERFVLGGWINVEDDLKELGSMRLDGSMRGLFEFRSGLPIEQTRLFGFFALPGAFVATSFRARGEFDVEEGDDPQRPWDMERLSSEATWRGLFRKEEYVLNPWPVLTQEKLDTYLEAANG